MVSVALAAVVPEMVTEAGKLQVTGLVAPEGEDVVAHVRLTAPVNPEAGVTLTASVLPVVAPGRC